MAQHQRGWPLGLQPLNARVGLIRRSLDFSGSLSFNTLNTNSPTSSLTSSDLDTESTGSLFHERRSITLGSLIGITTILDLSTSQQQLNVQAKNKKKRHNYKATMACFSLCPKSHLETENNNNYNNNNNTPSLGHFLEVERRERKRDPPTVYEVEGFPLENRHGQSCSLFSNGSIAPPPPPLVQTKWDLDLAGNEKKSSNRNGYWFPSMILCM